MQHLKCTRLPALGDMFGERNRWEVIRITSHVSGRSCTLKARDRFAQGDYCREFSAAIY